jgi:hypothetical protein
MYAFLYRLGSWLLTKLIVAAVIVALGLAGWGLWLYLSDEFSAEEDRLARLEHLAQEKERLAQFQAEIAASLTALRAEVETQQERVARAERILATFRDLESWWDRWFGNKEQQALNEKRRDRMEHLHGETVQRIQQLFGTIGEEEQRLEMVGDDLLRVDQEMSALAEAESKATHYLRVAWDHARLYLLIALLVFFFGPTLFKLFAYYLLAPLLARGRAIRLAQGQAALPAVGASRVSVDTPLWPGEVLRVKEKFLQASDEGLTRKTKFVLDWRIPVTSIACGLIELVEMRNGRAVGEQRVTFSTMDDPHTELAVIAVPEGGSIILRPSFLAGVITSTDKPLKIRRRWALLRWQAWITLQFRFFEFAGPCRLIVAGTRGVRGERLVEGAGLTRPARRANKQATIGFTPNLDYLPVRAETFWSYYRGMNPLFDDLFAGEGIFVLQETTSAAEGNRVGRFWSSVWNGVLKVFGL